MPNLLLVMLGGAAGAGLRYGVGIIAVRRLGTGFPWGTLIVNLSGGLAAGLLLGYLIGRGEAADPWRLLLGVGLLGGFTTFSAFSAETAWMIERGELAMAALYVLASTAGAILLLFAGLWLARVAA